VLQLGIYNSLRLKRGKDNAGPGINSCTVTFFAPFWCAPRCRTRLIHIAPLAVSHACV